MQDTKKLQNAEYKSVQSLSPLRIVMRNLFLTTGFEIILKSIKCPTIVAIILLTKIEK